ncbi:FAD-binding oxidoreductase [Neoaquamicrobium microcysteis]|uniref:FAD-binding oxidoreductase n=1 Tax=Neoaquamicrobium microcysteis TaxID=2682781 RepID=UPI001F3111B3|nr:FAD-binding oxidoreductase [Mesorhizobium microcysteis]
MSALDSDRIASFIACIRPLLDRNGVLEGDAVGPARDRDATEVPGTRPLALLRPRNAAELSSILSVASQTRQSIVIQGGRTGLAGGARPREGEVAVSLERLRALSLVDEANATIDAEAGVPLELVQKAAREANLYFGIDLGARGTATVGGMISTNAGGIRVLRHGMFRDQVAGIEGVLADGTVVDSLRGLPKDNAGYDLRQLFIGTEGTLGVVTKAKLRLSPAPVTESAALLSLGSVADAITLLAFLRTRIGDLLAAFEMMLPNVYEGSVAHGGLQPPLPFGAAIYVLTDIQGRMPEADTARFHAALAETIEGGLVQDAVLSSSGREFHGLWAIREGINDYIFAQGEACGLDVGVPLAGISSFLSDAERRVCAIDDRARVFVFGHLGDGNLHYIVQTDNADAVTGAVLEAAAKAGGTISAEHGIGQDKREWLHLCRSEADIAIMRRLKRALDPAGILNPERVIPNSTAHTQ